MKIVVFRDKSGTMIKYETAQKYLDRGKTYDQIESAVQTYNTTPNATTAEIVDAESIFEEIVAFNASSCELLTTDEIIHTAREAVPKNTYIYEFKKHPEHGYLAMGISRYFGDNVRLPEVNTGEPMLPVAWCKAADLQAKLGFTKKNIAELYSDAKAMAWSWWKEDKV